MKAFILGAGLGKRLRPLTDWLPKPMIPVFHWPLITYGFDHLLAHGVTSFIVNTHHYPQVYRDAFSEGHYRGASIAFRHEPVLLDTAGGIANVADWLGEERTIVYNGDILSDAPLGGLLRQHLDAKNEVTLLVRTSGPDLHVGVEHTSGQVRDIRRSLASTRVDQWYQFTGIYVIEAGFRRRLIPGKKESVVPVFLAMIDAGEETIGAYVSDEGRWWDLGNEVTYRKVHCDLPGTGFIRRETTSFEAVHASADVHSSATLEGRCCVGPLVCIGENVHLRDVIVWPGAEVEAGSRWSDAVIRGTYAQHRRYFEAARADFAAR